MRAVARDLPSDRGLGRRANMQGESATFQPTTPASVVKRATWPAGARAGCLDDGGGVGHPAQHRLVNLQRPISSRAIVPCSGVAPSSGCVSGRRLAPGGAGGGHQDVLEAFVVEPKTRMQYY